MICINMLLTRSGINDLAAQEHLHERAPISARHKLLRILHQIGQRYLRGNERGVQLGLGRLRCRKPLHASARSLLHSGADLTALVVRRARNRRGALPPRGFPRRCRGCVSQPRGQAAARKVRARSVQLGCQVVAGPLGPRSTRSTCLSIIIHRQ
jgi:hypothetical protein